MRFRVGERCRMSIRIFMRRLSSFIFSRPSMSWWIRSNQCIWRKTRCWKMRCGINCSSLNILGRRWASRKLLLRKVWGWWLRRMCESQRWKIECMSLKRKWRRRRNELEAKLNDGRSSKKILKRNLKRSDRESLRKLSKWKKKWRKFKMTSVKLWKQIMRRNLKKFEKQSLRGKKKGKKLDMIGNQLEKVLKRITMCMLS